MHSNRIGYGVVHGNQKNEIEEVIVFSSFMLQRTVHINQSMLTKIEDFANNLYTNFNNSDYTDKFRRSYNKATYKRERDKVGEEIKNTEFTQEMALQLRNHIRDLKNHQTNIHRNSKAYQSFLGALTVGVLVIGSIVLATLGLAPWTTFLVVSLVFTPATLYNRAKNNPEDINQNSLGKANMTNLELLADEFKVHLKAMKHYDTISHITTLTPSRASTITFRASSSHTLPPPPDVIEEEEEEYDTSDSKYFNASNKV